MALDLETASDRSRPWLWPSTKVRVFTALLGVLCLMAALAGFIAPYNFRTQHRQTIALPPTRIHFFDAQGRFHPRPFVYQVERVPGTRQYVENTAHRYPIKFFVRGEKYTLSGLLDGSVHLFGTDLERPARIHLLGTDHLGRDVFSRLVYGSQVTLSIALATLAISLLLGVGVGCASGYLGGSVDGLLQRLGELIQSIPAIFLILALRAAFPLELSFGKTLLMLVVIFALASWPEISRLVRSNVLSLKARDFVMSAHSIGAGGGWILWHHVLPNTLTTALVQAAIIIPSFILGEAALSFLGVGIREPQPSWGNMLAPALDITILVRAWWMLTPGVAILLTVALFNALGDAIREALDPRARARSPVWG